MPGLVPGIHAFLSASNKQDVDGRDKPGHDGVARSQLYFALSSILSTRLG
jgi:hypothetical protein